MSTTLEADNTGAKHGRHEVTISVNEKPVSVLGPKTSGLAIKKAAVAAQLPVTIEFVLSKEKPNGDTDVIGDSDELTVSKNSRFVLLHPDDNS